MTPKKIIIFANGIIENSKKAKRIASDAQQIICADGGAVHCAELGIIPDLIIGDFDSIPKKIRKKFAKHKVEIKQYPIHKDYTDLELALQQAAETAAKCEKKEKGKKKAAVHIVAGLGGRWDMSLATLLLPASHQYHDLEIIIHGKEESMQVLAAGRHTISGKRGQRVSFLPLCGDAKGITLAGFEYAAGDITLKFGSSRGVSNTLVEESGLIRIKEGMLMMVREDG